MIVSHRHRFIFLAVPRTASHAIRAALGPLLGAEDWQQEQLRLGTLSPLPALAKIRHGHVTARQACEALPNEWQCYFKFAVVREPFARFVSICGMLHRRNPGYVGRERMFMKRALLTRAIRARALVRPQTEFLVDADGQLALDRVIRYECLETSFAAICDELGIVAPALARHNAAASHPPLESLYDAELEAMVAHFYRRDFGRFDYRNRLCA